MRKWLAGGGLAMALLAFAGSARGEGNLVLYCAVQEEWCRAMVTAFERQTGIKVAMTRKSSGEFYAQLQAEAANPRGDVWWGGTGDPHMQAAEDGLTVEYKSAKLGELQDWAMRQWEQSKGRTVGIRAARALPAREALEPWLERRAGIATIVTRESVTCESGRGDQQRRE